MTEVVRIPFADRDAYLHSLTGEGILTLPSPDDDLPNLNLDGRPMVALSLHETGWEHALGQLDALGWEPSEGDHGEPLTEVWADTSTGRPVEVVILYGRGSIVSEPELSEIRLARRELGEASGLTPT